MLHTWGMDKVGEQGPASRERELVERFREVRQTYGISQEELSQRLIQAGLKSMNQMAVSRLEKGKRTLRFHEAVVIAEVLGQSLSRLMDADYERDADLIRFTGLEAQAEAELDRLGAMVQESLRKQAELANAASQVGFAMTKVSSMMSGSLLPIQAVVRRAIHSYFKGEFGALAHDFINNEELRLQEEVLDRIHVLEEHDPKVELDMLKEYLRRVNGVDSEGAEGGATTSGQVHVHLDGDEPLKRPDPEDYAERYGNLLNRLHEDSHEAGGPSEASESKGREKETHGVDPEAS